MTPIRAIYSFLYVWLTNLEFNFEFIISIKSFDSIQISPLVKDETLFSFTLLISCL